MTLRFCSGSVTPFRASRNLCLASTLFRFISKFLYNNLKFNSSVYSFKTISNIDSNNNQRGIYQGNNNDVIGSNSKANRKNNKFNLN